MLVGLVSAYVSAQQPAPQPPVFSPAANPYANGIYANGIVESHQSHGANISVLPRSIRADHPRAGRRGRRRESRSRAVTIDDSVQRETTEQQKAQLDVAKAQIANARAGLKRAADTLAKQDVLSRSTRNR